jgi:hypothetical protein
MNLQRPAAMVLFCLAMSGCAVGGGRLHVAADRQFDRAALDRLMPGMEEGAVVAALGLPAAFGVDDRGRRYLQYRQYSYGSQVIGAGTGFVGVNATMIRSSARGFEARVYLDGGRLTRIATRVYSLAVDEPAAASADAPADHGR